MGCSGAEVGSRQRRPAGGFESVEAKTLGADPEISKVAFFDRKLEDDIRDGLSLEVVVDVDIPCRDGSGFSLEGAGSRPHVVCRRLVDTGLRLVSSEIRCERNHIESEITTGVEVDPHLVE